jgi:hypothetical protein
VTSSIIYFLLAVSGTSAVIFVLMMRADNVKRRASSDGGSYDPGISSSSDGWSLASWFGFDNAGQSTDTSGSWDSSSVSDGGGSGGDGGGGGSD